jgi:hypothetical protein
MAATTTIRKTIGCSPHLGWGQSRRERCVPNSSNAGIEVLFVKTPLEVFHMRGFWIGLAFLARR